MAEPVRSAALAGVPHGFFGIAPDGGQYGYGANEDPRTVEKRRREAAEMVAHGARLLAPHQTHSNIALRVDNAWKDEPTGRPEGDALVTDRRSFALGIVTADCAPVLIADRKAGVIGAAHAGWRGALGDGSHGVLEAVVSEMEQLGADRSRIAAAIGPTIAQQSYEVDESFRARFGPEAACLFEPGRAGHWQFDLPGYVSMRLLRLGIGQVDNLAIDTYQAEKKWFSYRRASHHDEPSYGRNLAVIALA